MRGEDVTVLSPGQIVDAYSGEAAEDWDAPTERVVTTTAPPEPRPSSEPTQVARNSVVSGWTLYFPAGDLVTAHDRIVVRGTTYPVQGEPANWGPAGVIVQVFKTEG